MASGIYNMKKIIRKLKFIHIFKNFLKIHIFTSFKNTKYNFEEIKSNEFILHHHLGLGDAIICNGIVNYLSTKFKNIILPVYEKNYEHLSFLYSENKNVKLLKINHKKDIYSQKLNHEVLRVGFEKNYGKFNISFYDQLNLPYSISFDYFNLPINKEKEDELYKHLFNVYGISDRYKLVHQTSSYGKVEIKLKNDVPAIYVEKETDIFNNIFLYHKLIKNAEEIHCIDSSFLHLVERIPTDAKLYFHAVKKESMVSEKLELYKNWNIII